MSPPCIFSPFPEYTVKRKIFDNGQNSSIDSFTHEMKAIMMRRAKGKLLKQAPSLPAPPHQASKSKAITLQSWGKLQRLVLPSKT